MANLYASLFTVRGLTACELTEDELPALQAFFEANPLYFESVNGEPPGPDTARETLDDAPPPEMSFSKKFLIGFHDEHDRLVGVAEIVSNLLARGVWHIGLFIVETSRHGNGDAQALHDALVHWCLLQGVQWMRLGVVEGNIRAERFWVQRGYIETRKRHGLVMGQRTNTVRVMMKPLAGGTIEEYLALVPRDRPD
ncbi:MAG: GNAT family N-acetyltransferase [Betaproteobacteria bacterium]|nr:GNAT family N-acetyltransferase [Betaproteobacteria bacterium]